MPIEHFMRSLAETAVSRAVGVVLAGTGKDGWAGLRAIKGACGLLLPHDPETALQEGMARAAIDAGVVDSEGDIPAFGAQIVELSHRLKDNLRQEIGQIARTAQSAGGSNAGRQPDQAAAFKPARPG